MLLVILVLFLLRGIMNGMLAEFSGLLGLFGGLWYANYAYKDLAPYVAKLIRDPAWCALAAYVLVLISVLAAVALLAYATSKVLSFTVLPPLDKSLGAALGLVRGMLICAICLVLLRHFLPDANFFSNSRITPWLETFMQFARLYLPASLV
jgi:membrane protein required for colicin V production